MAEWLDEPDREEFEYSGYKCLIWRHPELRHLCGYVGIARGHVCYGRDGEYLPYNDIFDIHVHGGLTFSGEGNGDNRPKGYWWLGFDCAHYNELVPQILEEEISFGDEVPLMSGNAYRNFKYVREQIQSLVIQFKTLDFIDWQFKWVWPFLLPVRAARRIWERGSA